MKILAFVNGSGSGTWRLEDPFKYLNQKGYECFITKKSIPQCWKEGLLEWADIIIPQGCVDKEGLACIYAYQQERGKKIVIDMDDRLGVDEDNPHWVEHQHSDAQFTVQRSIEIADLVTTTNPYLANQLKKHNQNVTIIPNHMDLERWMLPHKPNDSGRIRIGWAGSITHLKDLEMIENVLKRIAKEFRSVDIIIVGDPRYRLKFKEVLNSEVMLGVPFDAWPQRLNGLRLDIGLAPLRDTDFARCKSPIKAWEYGINHVPGVFSPTVYGNICREFDGKLGLIANTPDEWYQCIKNLIKNKTLRLELGRSIFSYVRQHCDLKKHIYLWEDAYNSVL